MTSEREAILRDFVEWFDRWYPPGCAVLPGVPLWRLAERARRSLAVTPTDQDKQFMLIGRLASELAKLKGWDFVFEIAEGLPVQPDSGLHDDPERRNDRRADA